jgi:antitoxin VapB
MSPRMDYRPLVEWYTFVVERWTMALNIKNPETHRLAEELARRTGENMTQAVTTALRERLERVRESQGEPRIERLQKIVNDMAARFKEPYKSIDHGELLYDEKGLPK